MYEMQLGNYLLIAILSMAISMAIIPVMIKLAPYVGMVDKPDQRKVHTLPIPRVGGVGIVIGALLPMFIWLPMNDLMISFLFGSVVLLVFGVWDDIAELGHYVKFIGQIIAVIAVVYYGDLWVAHFPFIGIDTIPAYAGKPFTVIAIVGVINAINHSDGLDGLAGGESLLSLGAMAYFAYLFGGELLLIIAFATIGGIFGFLRYNSYPAKVFMGDGGSQFIGFTLGFLVVYLTQVVNPVLSAALPILLLGLPVADILAVFYLRAKSGVNLFKATRNHIHHRLLELGFLHYESVIIIYSIQVVFIISAILLPYGNDYFLMFLYMTGIFIVFSVLTLSERRGYKVHISEHYENLTKNHGLPSWMLKILAIPARILETGVSIFFIGGVLMAGTVPSDFGIAAVLLLTTLLLLLLAKRSVMIPYRLITFVTAGFAVYLLSSYPPVWLLEQNIIIYIFFGLLTIATFLTARTLSNETFQITPLDYLVIVFAMVIAFVPESGLNAHGIIMMSLQMIVLFYACEMIIQSIRGIYNRFTGTLVATLVIISLRALL
jgi:UDP-GlcNAc:undecaprenyl-phosphate/decaprenyl-phosphate GlcNAc-1-phosphate transferase